MGIKGNLTINNIFYKNIIKSDYLYSIPNLISKIIMVIYTIFLGYAIIWNGFFTKSKKEKYLMTPLSALGFISSLFAIIYVA